MTAVSPITDADDWYVGDDYPARWLVRDEAGGAVNITGWSLQMIVRRALDDPDALITKTTPSQISLADGLNGNMDIMFEDTDTQDLEPMTGVYAIKRTDPGLEETLAVGTAVLKKAATG